MRLLLDASAIVNLIGYGKLDTFVYGVVPPLAKYECMNVLWREAVVRKVISREEAKKLNEQLIWFFDVLDTYEPDGEKVFELAVKENITVYDATYLEAAIELGIPLVTDDEKLKNVAAKYVETFESDKIISE